MGTVETRRQTLAFLWLPFAIAALLACAIANGWINYSALEVILPKQFRGETVTVWGHALQVGALVLAAFIVAFEVLIGGIVEQAYVAADTEGFVSTRALRLSIIAVLLFVLIAGAELIVVQQRALTLQLELDLVRSKLTEHEIHIREADIARTRVLFTMLTTVTFGLTALLTGLVVRGFRTIAPVISDTVHRCRRAVGRTIASVSSAIAFAIGVLLTFVVEGVLFAVAGVIFAAWGIVLAAGTAVTWATEIVDLFLERLVRRPWRAIVAFWHRLWTPAAIEIEDDDRQSADHPPEDPPPGGPATGSPGTSAHRPVEYCTTETTATLELGTNGTATTTSGTSTQRPEVRS